MILRFFLPWAVCLFGLPALAGQHDHYPFSVVTEKTPNGHRIVARNAGPAPVSVVVAIPEFRHISTDRPFPIYAVVPPGGGTLFLGNIYPALQGGAYSFRTQYTWMLGDMNAAQSPDATYRLPYRDGSTFRIGQAPGGPITTHATPDSQFAIDIPMPEGTPIVAARAGTVIYTEANQIYGAQVPDMLDKANEVRIKHIDGTMATYAHLSHGGVFVYPGQRVEAGQQIGLAGSTGYSSGPHLHFAVQTVRRNGNGLAAVSLPFQFYVGNPPIYFSPRFGLLAKAEYASPGSIPGSGSVTQVAANAPPSSAPNVLTGGVSITIEPQLLGLFEKIRQRANDLGVYAWLGGVGFVLFVLNRRTRKAEERRRRERSYKEPGMRRKPW